jgi:purine-binding chemotaxis protein CheW
VPNTRGSNVAIFNQTSERRDADKQQLSGEKVHVVSFRLGTEEYGVDISQVQEIIRMVEITHVPRAPHFMEGVINLRGQLIPIIDLRTRFAMQRGEHTKNTRIVVTEIGSKKVGIIVDSVSEVINIPIEQVEEAPDMIAGVGTEYIQGVGKVADRLVILLDLTMVITGEEKAQLENLEA